MTKITGKMIEYNNSVSRILKIHGQGWKVFAFCSDGSKVFGKVSVIKKRLYIGENPMENKLITQVYYTDRKRNEKNGNEKEAQ